MPPCRVSAGLNSRSLFVKKLSSKVKIHYSFNATCSVRLFKMKIKYKSSLYSSMSWQKWFKQDQIKQLLGMGFSGRINQHWALSRILQLQNAAWMKINYYSEETSSLVFFKSLCTWMKLCGYPESMNNSKIRNFMGQKNCDYINATC